jgi:hypothetical protein
MNDAEKYVIAQEIYDYDADGTELVYEQRGDKIYPILIF